MSFLSGVFVIDFEVTKAFLTKLNFDCSSKLFSERNFSQKVRDKISELEFDLYITLNFHYKKYLFHYSNFLLYGKFHYMVFTRFSAGKMWLPFYMQNGIRLVDGLTVNFDVRICKKLHGHNCLFQLPVKLPRPFHSNTTSI